MLLGSEKYSIKECNIDWDSRPDMLICRIICSECDEVLGTAIFPKYAPAQVMPFMVSDDSYNGDDVTYITLGQDFTKYPTLCPLCWSKTVASSSPEETKNTNDPHSEDPVLMGGKEE